MDKYKYDFAVCGVRVEPKVRDEDKLIERLEAYKKEIDKDKK